MQQLTSAQWAILAGVYLALAAHTAWSMRRAGRRFWLWLAISVLATPAPATIVAFYDYFRSLAAQHRAGSTHRPGPGRCLHCGGLLEGNTRRVAGREICNNCNLAVDEDVA
jgi:hypothetical protein